MRRIAYAVVNFYNAVLENLMGFPATVRLVA